MSNITWDAIEMLRESNNIEDEWGDLSLQQAIFAWDYCTQQKQLIPSVVLKTHKILMLHHLVGNQKGYFREQQVWVGQREGAPWYAVPTLIENWCKKANFVLGITNPVKGIEDIIKDDHIAYEHIHPFIDGNGRTGRIFLNWQRVKAGLPILTITEKEKSSYYEWFW